MFKHGKIVAYPTNTSYGLGVRVDDSLGLDQLADLKGGREGKYFSLMVRDMDMLREYAEVPDLLLNTFFIQSPKTVILTPSKNLPQSRYWPEKVAFRVCTVPEVAECIEVPITATSANLAGAEPCFTLHQIESLWGDRVDIFPYAPDLELKNPSQIWDLTDPSISIRIR